MSLISTFYLDFFLEIYSKDFNINSKDFYFYEMFFGTL